MLTIEQLNNIYDEGVQDGPGPGPGPKAPKPIKIGDFKKYMEQTPARLATTKSGQTSAVNVEDYKGYNTEGVYSNRDINAVRGENQSALDKWGNFVPRAIAKVATGVIEGIGYAGALLTEWGDDRDYSNGLTESMKSANEFLDENLPIYRTTDKIWGLGDLGWYLQNAEGLISSLGSFAISGAGIAKGVGLVGKISGLAKASEFISGGVRLGQQVSRVLTAGALAYQEGALMGNSVFQEVYKTNLQKSLANGDDVDTAHEKAKHIAAQSAATSVQLNTMMNTGMNMWSVLPFFNHEERAIERIAKKHFFQKAGESVDDWAARVQGYTVDGFKKHAFKNQGLAAMGREAFLEGTEELTNQFAERTGREEGNKSKVHGFLGQLGQLSKYFDRTMDSEGALNFVMGAIAGPMTNVVTTNIPMHRVQVGVQENVEGTPILNPGTGEAVPMYKVMSSRNKNKFGNTNYFNNIKDAIQEDIKFYQDKHAEIKTASAQGNLFEAERLKEDLFNLNNRRAVQLGYAENLKETYEQIAGMDNKTAEKDNVLLPQISELQAQLQDATDNGQDTTKIQEQITQLEEQYQKSPAQTEAMRNGFTSSVEDNGYVERAKDAVKTLDELQELHEKVMSKYNIDNRDAEDPLKIHLADFIFDRYANLKLQKKKLDEWEKKLGEITTEQSTLENVISGEELDTHVSLQKEYERARTGLVASHARLVTEDGILEEALKTPNPKTLEAASKILEKYGAIGVTEADTERAIKDTRKKLGEIAANTTQRIREEDERMLNSTGYNGWLAKHPGKSFVDYQAEVNKKYGLTEDEKILRTSIADLKNRIKSNSDNLREIETARTMDRIIKATKGWMEKLAEERKSYLEAETTRLENTKENLALQERLNLSRLKSLSNSYVTEMEQIKGTVAQLTDRIEAIDNKLENFETSDDIKTMKLEKRIDRWEKYLQEKQQLTNMLTQATERFNVLQSLYVEVQNDIADIENYEPVSDTDVIEEDSPFDEEEQIAEEKISDDSQMEEAFVPGEQAAEKSIEQKRQELREKINSFPDDMLFMTHVTRDEWAKSIFNGQFKYNLGTGLNGTFGVGVGKETIFNILSDMLDGNSPHQGYLGMFIAAIPKSELQSIGRMTADNIETYLMEVYPEMAEGKIPTKFNFAYFADGELNIKGEEQQAAPEATPAPEQMPPAISALQGYQEVLQSLPADVQRKLKSYEIQLKLEEAEFSYDALQPEVSQGKISVEHAGQALQALREFVEEYMEALNQDGPGVSVVQNILETQVPELESTEGMEVESTKPIHDSLVTNNTDVEVNYLPTTEEKKFAGRKTVDAYNSMANMGEEYDEVFNAEKNTYVKIGLGTINSKANKDVFDPKKLKPGTRLLMVIDEEYDGAKNVSSRHTEDEYGHRQLGSEKFEDYATEDGRVKDDEESIGNVPIKIVDENNNTVGYLRKNEWITTRYDAIDGPEGYRNVYDGSNQEGDIPPGNVQRQAATMLQLRKYLVDKYNRGEKEGVLTEVSHKGAGNIMLNREISNVVGEEGKITWNRASKLLPDTTLQIGIYRNGKVLVDRGNTEFGSKIVTQIPAQMENRTVFMLPGNNGEYHAAIAKGINLMDNNIALNTISRAIELSLENNPDSTEAAKLAENTGFDVRDPQQLKAFINQYFTHTTNWNSVTTSPTGREVTVLDIIPPLRGEFNSKVIIGTVSVAGPSSVTATLVRGKLAPEFRTALQNLLASRLKNVVFSNPALGIRGMNEQVTDEAKFVEPRADSKGNFSFIRHSNYNEYIKKHLLVNVNGTNKVDVKDSRGRTKSTYVYAVNPRIEYKTEHILNAPVITASTSNTVLEDPGVVQETADSMQDLFDSMINGMLPTTAPITPIATTEGNEVTLDNLSKLHNFTAEEDRNGKSVEEVYTYLLSNGITNIYEGFNPFSKCK